MGPLKRLPLGWCGQNIKAISYMLKPLGYESYVLHTSAVMYTEKGVCDVERFYPKVGVG